ncbi:GNAT family N-acetyltransferase [Cohnella pontilimi]|uniref:GNAT family N-acetyltransferase n=1 Tax=Cohnella pontilimi TaxID=2564100 RepID=A0A4U0FD67_9BACL|nr:GNAT family N-acetyltransferase [Cohnella pontilimi]TJY42710.1 GNAT family N-acetyltransferase [Cohnella pontilimi]
MRIEQASKDDLPAVADVFKACVRDMLDRGIDQWDESYPNPEISRQDCADGSLFVARNDQGGVMGCLTMDENQAAEYAEVPWRHEGKVLMLHRLAVHPDYQRQGAARELMAFAEMYGRDRGYDAIRLDAYSGNHRAIPFYPKIGYEKRGEVHFTRREKPYYCFEKSLH